MTCYSLLTYLARPNFQMMSNIVWEVCGCCGQPLRYVVHIVELAELEEKKKEYN